MDSPKNNEWMDLILRHANGELSEEETIQLNQLLANDRRFLLTYIEIMDSQAEMALASRTSDSAGSKHGDLLVDIDAVWNAPPASEPIHVREARPSGWSLTQMSFLFAQMFQWNKHPVRFAGLAVALTLAFWAMWLAVVGFRGTQDRVANRGDGDTTMSRFAAQIVHSVDAKWDNESDRVFDGAFLQKDQVLKLSNGLAEVRFDSGVRVVLEAPAEFRVLTRNSGEIEAGKLAAQVPPAAYGFNVTTPTAYIVDVGTAFGVEVIDREATDVRILDGAVDVAPVSATGKIGSKVLLEAGQTARVDHTTVRIVDTPRETRPFVRTLPRPLRNGSFQSPDISSNSFAEMAITGWNRTETSGEDTLGDGNLMDSSGLSAGEQFALFNEQGTPIGDKLFQSFDTIPGAKYEVSFEVMHLFAGSGDATLHAEVFDGGMPGRPGTGLANLTETNANPVTTNPPATFSFIAVSTTSTIVFTDQSTGIDVLDTGLDNVEISIVTTKPLPTSPK